MSLKNLHGSESSGGIKKKIVVLSENKDNAEAVTKDIKNILMERQRSHLAFKSLNKKVSLSEALSYDTEKQAEEGIEMYAALAAAGLWPDRTAPAALAHVRRRSGADCG